MQNFFINLSPGLLPLMVIPLSFVQVWHCMAMCGSNFSAKDKSSKNNFLVGRAISYSVAGGVFGHMGANLKNQLEMQVLGGIAFVIFLIISLFLAIKWSGVDVKLFPKKLSSWRLSFASVHTHSAFVQGLLSVALPCSLLLQVFALATLSHSVVGGTLVGLSHSVTSSLGLIMSSRVLDRIFFAFKTRQWIAKAIIFALIVFNLFFFAGKWLHSEETAKTKIMFCF